MRARRPFRPRAPIPRSNRSFVVVGEAPVRGQLEAVAPLFLGRPPAHRTLLPGHLRQARLIRRSLS